MRKSRDEILTPFIKLIQYYEKLVNQNKIDVNKLQSVVKTLLSKYDILEAMFDYSDDFGSNVHTELKQLMGNNLIADGNTMLRYLANHIDNLQTYNNNGCNTNFKSLHNLIVHDKLIIGLSDKIVDKSTLYTLYDNDFIDANLTKIHQTVPSDYDKLIFKPLISQVFAFLHV